MRISARIISIKFVTAVCRGLCLLLLVGATATHGASEHPSIAKTLSHLIGPSDSIVIANTDGRILFGKHVDTPLIPASTLKIVTALVAIDILRSDHRFVTEFYFDRRSNLIVKGFGDPMLISEVWADVAAQLAARGDTVNDIVLDDAFFADPIVIPGVHPSLQPYDAPNGALCANFNTIHFKRTSEGKYVSAEAQTPLLDLVMPRIRASARTHDRIVLPQKGPEKTLYAGHLLRYFLLENRVGVTGRIRIGRVDPESVRLILRYESSLNLRQVVGRMMAYSNNFIANQILLAAGARRYGPPATLEKGVRCAREFLIRHPTLKDIGLVEGSGISRQNRISAATMVQVLALFEPYRSTLRRHLNETYKTGTLDGVSTRVGYIETHRHGLLRFAVFVNTPGKTTRPIMDRLQLWLETK